MLYVILWLLCGLAAAAIYRSKGRSAVVALVAGLLLGPVAVVLAALTPASRAGQERQLLAEGYRRCPHCAEPIRQDARVCRHCGRDAPA